MELGKDNLLIGTGRIENSVQGKVKPIYSLFKS